jgi:quercetin dioxygenase-like cupin family protein
MTTKPLAPLPPDDLNRQMTVVNAGSPGIQHLSLAGNVYSILLTGKDTAGRYCLIDMRVPHCGGPVLHRHDFEEMFTVLEGEIEFTFRGTKTRVPAGTTVNIPANAPHCFTNPSSEARMLCMCTPAGQEEFFLKIGDRVESRTSPPVSLSNEELETRMKRATELAPHYRTELLSR